MSQPGQLQAEQKATFHTLMRLWPGFGKRDEELETGWMESLCTFLQDLVDRRIMHVQAWVDSNLSQYNGSNAAIEELRRALDTISVELKRSVQLCKTRCSSCYLLCLGIQFHEGVHDCSTDHRCPIPCQFSGEHYDEPDPCALPYASSYFPSCP